MTPIDRNEDSPVVTLLTRQHCGLCEEAQLLLESEAAALGFHLRVKDVDEDPDLVAEYGDWVPVALDPSGDELFRLRADAGKLHARLRDALGSAE